MEDHKDQGWDAPPPHLDQDQPYKYRPILDPAGSGYQPQEMEGERPKYELGAEPQVQELATSP
ncbi:hypothetical protein LTR36_009580 [Oleoguttula mirabilis]|uniref:Uncharacterized protein n=1 Tax=Oleoguttula mirabilis TaxID=1507867 RepID=A0AAV9JT21_9PEZI|nr:hypothetical protein LTR36_009580 [Oleoguttula mirabilis]